MNGLDNFLGLFGNITISTVIYCAIAIGFVVAVCKALKSFLKEKIKQDDETKESMNKILSISERIPLIENKLNEMEKTQLDTITRINKIEEENNRREIDTLKSRLMEYYNYYANAKHNPTGCVTSIEFQAFEEIYETYRNAGGDGWIENVVYPQLCKLTVVDINDTESIAELMSSRK